MAGTERSGGSRIPVASFFLCPHCTAFVKVFAVYATLVNLPIQSCCTQIGTYPYLGHVCVRACLRACMATQFFLKNKFLTMILVFDLFLYIQNIKNFFHVKGTIGQREDNFLHISQDQVVTSQIKVGKKNILVSQIQEASMTQNLEIIPSQQL